MIRHYIKITIKNCINNKWLSLIKVGGLAIGIASIFYITQWLNDEFKYDQFHPESHQIYRVISEVHEQSGLIENAFTPSPLIPTIKTSASEVERATRYRPGGRLLLKYKQNAFYESQGALADHDFFNVFHFPLIAGNPSLAFQDPMAIVISEAMAAKYFGDEDPIGKSITVENMLDFHVTGVFKTIPSQSHLQFDFLMSLEIAGKVDLNDWATLSDYSYIKMKSEVNGAVLLEKMNDLVPQNSEANTLSFSLQPIHDIHLHSHFLNDVPNNGHMETCLVFIGIGILLFAITTMNYINLTLAKRQVLLKEYGIRSTLGAEVKNFIHQLLTDSGIHLIQAVLLAILIVQFSLPFFNQVTYKTIEFTNVLPVLKISFVYGLIIFCVLILSVLHIIKKSPSLLINRPVMTRYSLKSNRIFVIIQFILATILIISAWISTKQIRFIMQANLGFSNDALISMPVRVPMEPHFQSIKNKIMTNHAILNVTASSALPFQAVDKKWQEVSWIQNDEGQKGTMQYLRVDPDFIDVMQIELFSSNQILNSKEGVFLNRKAKDLMGLDIQNEQTCMINNQEKYILGITDNFHYQSLYHLITPMIMEVTDQPLAHLIVKCRHSTIQPALKHLENIWEEYYPGYPFEYVFVNQLMEKAYQQDVLLNQLVLTFTIISIIIACLGLLAVTLFTFEQRTKEIAIRKSIGASIMSVIWMLLKQIIAWIILANIIAWPLAWFILRFWLSHFAYASEISISSFILASILLTSIAVFTMLWHTFKTASVNPACILKYE